MFCPFCRKFALMMAAVLALAACRQQIQAGRPLVNLVRPNTLPTEPRTTQSAQMISLETPLRCEIQNAKQDLMTVIPFRQSAFRLERTEKSDPLPRYEVTGFSFEAQTTEKVFYSLLKEAKIQVLGIDGPFPELTAESISGELNDVMNKIAAAADVYYRYVAQQKVLMVSREVSWILHVPGEREVMIAVLDAMRGSGMHDLLVNWEDSTIAFKGDKSVETKMRQLMDLFDKEPKLIVFDVQVLRLKPHAPAKEVNWQDLITVFGPKAIRFSLNGVLGRTIVSGNEINIKSLKRFLNTRASYTQVSEGLFIAANKWRARFDVGRCGYMSMPEAQLSVMAQTELKEENRLETLLTLDSDRGEITSFDIKSVIGDSIVIFGMPSSSFSESLNGYETLIVLTPRVIRLVKELN